jgi:hypothetical protein
MGGIEEIPPRTHLTLELIKPKIEPLCSRIWEEIKGKRITKGSSIHPHQFPKRKALKLLHEKHQERDLKITKREKRERHT